MSDAAGRASRARGRARSRAVASRSPFADARLPHSPLATPRARPFLTPRSTDADAGDNAGVKCTTYKRTFASMNAEGDAKWAENNLGWTSEYKQTYSEVDGMSCASRELMLSLGEWSTHFFTSYVTPQGDVSVAQWVSFWSELHGNLSDVGFAWDAWMHHSMTYYVPELTPFLAKWAENGTPFLARKYVNALDGETLFAAYINIPHTGVIVELISAELADSDQDAFFRELEPASCAGAVRVNRTLAEMNGAWASMAGRMANEMGLPDALIVQLSMPTAADPSAFGSYLQRYASSNITVEAREARYVTPGSDETARAPDDHAARDRACEWASARLKLQPSPTHPVDWHIDVKAVRNPLAAGGVRGVPARVEATSGVRADASESPVSPADATSIAKAREDRPLDYRADQSGGFESNLTEAGSMANYSVAHFEKVVVEANAELLGCNSGWSRYLDWHLGVACDSPQSLDKIGPKLCVDGSGFHGHVSSANKKVSSEGSLWAAGVGGLGVEFHMDFTWEFFNESRMVLLDYCSGTSRGICTTASCDESDLIRRH